MDWWQPTILVDVKRDLLDVVSLLINAILGSAAVYSLWLSRKVLKKSEFDSAMSTSPSIIIRPRSIYVGVKQKEEYAGYGVVDGNGIIKKDSEIWEIIFCIEFECFNAGRGAAFNISQPKVTSVPALSLVSKKTPLYLTKEDDSFEIKITLAGKFDEIYKLANTEIPVEVSLVYTNDQSNIFCRSNWSAKIKPFDQVGADLKVRDTRLLQRSGKIEYSQEPYE